MKKNNFSYNKFPRLTFIILVSALICSGCSCKEAYMPNIDIVRPDDALLSCEGLRISIIQMKALLENVKVRCSRPHLFSPYPPCTLWVKQDAARNYHIIHDRVAFLDTLQKNQNCHLDSLVSEEYEGTLNEPGVSNFNQDYNYNLSSSEKCCKSLGLSEGQIKGEMLPRNETLNHLNINQESVDIPPHINEKIGDKNYMLPDNGD